MNVVQSAEVLGRLHNTCFSVFCGSSLDKPSKTLFTLVHNKLIERFWKYKTSLAGYMFVSNRGCRPQVCKMPGNVDSNLLVAEFSSASSEYDREALCDSDVNFVC